jgi:hypothetical protein
VIPTEPSTQPQSSTHPSIPAQPTYPQGGTFVRANAFAWGAKAWEAGANPDDQAGSHNAEAVEQALAAAVKDSDRVTDLLDELSRGLLWLPLPGDGQPVTDGYSVMLPTVTYLGSEFVPAFTSAERLAWWGEEPVPHVVVPAAGLARCLPGGLGIALNPGADASVPVYAEGVTHLAAAEYVVGGTRIRVGHPPTEPEALLREISAVLRTVPAVQEACRTWLSVPGSGEGLVISVLLGVPVDESAQRAAIAAIEQAVEAAGDEAWFHVDVTFPGEAEPDDLDRWTTAHAAPFYLRG